MLVRCRTLPYRGLIVISCHVLSRGVGSVLFSRGPLMYVCVIFSDVVQCGMYFGLVRYSLV